MVYTFLQWLLFPCIALFAVVGWKLIDLVGWLIDRVDERNDGGE